MKVDRLRWQEVYLPTLNRFVLQKGTSRKEQHIMTEVICVFLALWEDTSFLCGGSKTLIFISMLGRCTTPSWSRSWNISTVWCRQNRCLIMYHVFFVPAFGYPSPCLYIHNNQAKLNNHRRLWYLATVIFQYRGMSLVSNFVSISLLVR